MKTLSKIHQPKSSLIKLVCLGALLTYQANAIAAFEVMEEPFYGNAQDETFRRAINSDLPLDSEDRTFLARVEEKRVGNRSYLKAQLGRPTSELIQVSNATTGVPGQPANRGTTEDTFHFVLGIGYKWVRFAVELEFLVSETFDYRTNPALSNPNYAAPPGGTVIQLRGDVKPWAIFTNLEYELPTFFDFIPSTIHPYVNLGVGSSVKTTNSRTATLGGQERQIKSSRSNDFAWHAGLGLKYQITGNLLVDFAYRWIALGDVKFGEIEGLTLKAKNLDTSGFYLGLTYQI